MQIIKPISLVVGLIFLVGSNIMVYHSPPFLKEPAQQHHSLYYQGVMIHRDSVTAVIHLNIYVYTGVCVHNKRLAE